jgi:hypothetical protein
MTRCMNGAQPQLAHREHFPIVEPEIRKRRGTFPMHHHGGIEFFTQLLGGGKMIRMGVRIDDIADADAGLRREREIAVDLPDFRIDKCGDVRVGTADEIGLAAPRRNPPFCCDRD